MRPKAEFDTLPQGAKDLRELPAVMVLWRDAASTGRWRALQDARSNSGTTRCRSVGFLTKCDEAEIQLAQSMGRGDVNDLITIPRPWATRLIVLRPGKPGTKQRR